MNFRNRMDAGEKLAEHLKMKNISVDIVLAVPRGGLPLGRKVADALNADLDVIVSRKISAPGNPELAIGAVGSDGTHWLNHDLIGRLGVDDDFIEGGIEIESERAAEKLEAYRKTDKQPDLSDKTVLIVDDGIATGATVVACVRQARNLGAIKVTVAVPVASPRAVELLKDEADEVITLNTPELFGAVGSFYSDFKQVSDDEARSYLRG